MTLVSSSLRLPGAETTTKRRSGSDFTMFKTFSNCVAEASELPPNLMTFLVTPKILNYSTIIAKLIAEYFRNNGIEARYVHPR